MFVQENQQLLIMIGQQMHTNTRLHIISRDALHSGERIPVPCFPLLAATLLIGALALVASVVGDLVVRAAGSLVPGAVIVPGPSCCRIRAALVCSLSSGVCGLWALVGCVPAWSFPFALSCRWCPIAPISS